MDTHYRRPYAHAGKDWVAVERCEWALGMSVETSVALHTR